MAELPWLSEEEEEKKRERKNLWTAILLKGREAGGALAAHVLACCFLGRGAAACQHSNCPDSHWLSAAE